MKKLETSVPKKVGKPGDKPGRTKAEPLNVSETKPAEKIRQWLSEVEKGVGTIHRLEESKNGLKLKIVLKKPETKTQKPQA